MSDTLVATLGGLCALLFWGFGDWVVARSSRREGALDVNLAFQLPGLLVSSVLALLARQHVHSTHSVLVLFAAGLIFSVAFVTFIKAFAAGSTGLVTPAACTYPLFTLVLTAIFLTLDFSHQQILAMLITVGGVMLLASEKRKRGVSLRVQHYATILALLTGFLWGVGNMFQNSVISKESWVVVFWSINFSMAIAGILMWFFFTQGRLMQKVVRVRASTTTMKAGAIYTLGSVGFYYSSVRVGSIIIPLVVSSASPLVSSALGAYYDQEHLALLKRVGAVVVVGGIIFLNLSS